MRDSKLLVLLQKMSDKELQNLHDFIKSPYFNKKADVVQFYEYLLLVKPDWQSGNYQSVQKEVVFGQMWEGQIYHAPTLYYLMSNLLALAEQFISVEALKNDQMANYNYLLSYYNSPNLDKHFSAALREAQIYQSQQVLDANYYRNQFLLHQHENLYFDKQKKHLFDGSLQQAIDQLDVHYLALKLKYSCEMLNRQKVVLANYELRLISEILHYLDTHPHEDTPAVAIYAAIYRCLSNSTHEQYFEQLKQLLHHHAAKFSTTEQRDMYAYLINYCIRKINQANSKYLHELFEIYKHLLANQLLLDENNHLSPWTYMNIVTIGIRNQDFVWTDDFIATYKTQIAAQFRHNAYHYNLAILRFNQQQYSATIGLLHQVVFDDVFYNTEARMLLLRTYYELNENDAFEALAVSFATYLKRSKLVAPEKAERCLQFIKLLQRLHKLVKSDTKALNLLKKKIDTTTGLMNKTWLLDKWNEKAPKR